MEEGEAGEAGMAEQKVVVMAPPPEEQPSSEQQQPAPFSLQNIVDDFSLQSQGIRFRAGREMRIYEQPSGGQLILEGGARGDASRSVDVGEEEKAPEEDDDDDYKIRDDSGTILIKSTTDHGYAFSFLRATYR